VECATQNSEVRYDIALQKYRHMGFSKVSQRTSEFLVAHSTSELSRDNNTYVSYITRHLDLSLKNQKELTAPLLGRLDFPQIQSLPFVFTQFYNYMHRINNL